MGDTVTLRTATRADCDEIAALHAESWQLHYRGAYRDEFLDGPVVQDRLDEWRRRFTSPPATQQVIVALADGRLAGFVCAYGSDDPEWGTLLDNLHVRQAYQRQGIGRALVVATAVWCLELHAAVGLYLWVLEQNTRAQSFYRQLGAVDRGGKTSEPPGGGSIAARRYVWSDLRDLASRR